VSIRNLRAALEELDETRQIVAILLDTKGPEIRTGKLAEGREIDLIDGQEFIFWCAEGESERKGDANGVWTTYANLPTTVHIGDPIMVDDGLLSFRVTEIGSDWVRCVLENGGRLGETKGINLPGNKVDLPALTDKDRQDVIFGMEQGVDFIAASFIRKASDVLEIRGLLAESGIKIISKIENQEGLENFDAILAVSDGIMVARGDLGVEIPVEDVLRAQKMMIRKCNAAGKPCITATQMLESMIVNPRPTRAEATDVENAVLDGSDCVMLSGETAKGAYPIKAVEMMVRLCRAAETDIAYGELYAWLRKRIQLPIPVNEAIASCAVKTAWDVQAACVVALTESGAMGRALAKYRPIPPVLALVNSAQVGRQLQISRGIYPLLVSEVAFQDRSRRRASSIGMGNTPYLISSHPLDGSNASIDSTSFMVQDRVAFAMRYAVDHGMALPGDPIVMTSGVIEGRSGTTNLMRVFKCSI
jgi:pyruvate kinase